MDNEILRDSQALIYIALSLIFGLLCLIEIIKIYKIKNHGKKSFGYLKCIHKKKFKRRNGHVMLSMLYADNNEKIA